MDINMTVADNVKRIREKKKMTLDTAAAVTGVSRSMLTQIEKGSVNPTISVLWKIANGYKVSFSSLVEENRKEMTFVPLASLNPVYEDEGKYVNYPIFPFNEDKLFETYRILIKQGGGLKAKPHLAESEEYVTVFSGQVEITVGEEVHLLKTGDSLHFYADQNHEYRNAGDGEAAMSMIICYVK